MGTGMPEQARKAGEEVDAALEELEREMAAGEQVPAEETPKAEPQPAEQESKPDVAPSVKDDTPKQPDNEPLLPPSEPAMSGPKYEQMYKTLKGKYDAEVPRLHRKIAELEAAQREKPPMQQSHTDYETITPETAKDMLKGVISENELNDLGDEALVLYAKIASGTARAQQAKLAAEMRQELRDLKSEIASSKLEDVWITVESAHPGARDINENDPGWGQFLNGVDPVSGLTYREIGERAAQRGEASRLIALFDLYSGNTSAHSEVVKEQPPVKPSQRSVASEASAPRPKQDTIKESDIAKFYNDVSRGHYLGKDNERAAREAEIDAAVAAGLVVRG